MTEEGGERGVWIVIRARRMLRRGKSRVRGRYTSRPDRGEWTQGGIPDFESVIVINDAPGRLRERTHHQSR